jgi:hypothetical protein
MRSSVARFPSSISRSPHAVVPRAILVNTPRLEGSKRARGGEPSPRGTTRPAWEGPARLRRAQPAYEGLRPRTTSPASPPTSNPARLRRAQLAWMVRVCTSSLASGPPVGEAVARPRGLEPSLGRGAASARDVGLHGSRPRQELWQHARRRWVGDPSPRGAVERASPNRRAPAVVALPARTLAAHGAAASNVPDASRDVRATCASAGVGGRCLDPTRPEACMTKARSHGVCDRAFVRQMVVVSVTFVVV